MFSNALFSIKNYATINFRKVDGKFFHFSFTDFFKQEKNLVLSFFTFEKDILTWEIFVNKKIWDYFSSLNRAHDSWGSLLPGEEKVCRRSWKKWVKINDEFYLIHISRYVSVGNTWFCDSQGRKSLYVIT